MPWTTDGLHLYDEQGVKIASVAYGRTRPCSMKISEETKRANLARMVKAPELAALLTRALPLLVQLGDAIGNGPIDLTRPDSIGARCDLIGDITAALNLEVEHAPRP